MLRGTASLSENLTGSAMTTTFDSGFNDWTPNRLPDLSGKRFLITGANAGLGFETAKMLRHKNADVLMAARNEGRGRGAVSNISAEPGSGSVDFVKLDLADTSSIRAAAESVRAMTDGLDAIVNNAGIMQTPQQKTTDGFEMQFGTNHLGHFLLNHLLFDLVEARGGRIVPVASIAAKSPAKFNFSDLMHSQNYSATMVYGQSKLANLTYGLELQRRLTAAGSSVSSISCHPGYAATNLQSTGPTGIWKNVYKVTNKLMAQPAERGAQPLALAAAGSEARPGGYYGPVDLGGARGKISDADIPANATADDAGPRLWEASENYLDISWTI